MTEIAPWDRGSLSPRLATIQREIEGRTRRFALWYWEERLVWQDVNYPQLWWATLEHAETVSDWERAIEIGRFGRAFTSDCNKAINGKRIGLWSSCTLHLSRTFYVIVSNSGAGIAREKANNFWVRFTPLDDEYTKKKRERAPSVWHSNREFFGVNREIMRAFAPALLGRLSPGLCDFIISGNESVALKAMKDLLALNVSRNILFNDFVRENRALYQKVIAGFNLPEESTFGAHGERKQINGVQLYFTVTNEYQRWSIGTSISLATTMHEILELQLRLCDALRPILTSAEIEEILAP